MQETVRREDAALSVVARRCAKLERLELLGPAIVVSAEGLSTLLAACPRLVELHIHRCDGKLMTGQVVELLANHPSGFASRLRALTLCGMRRLNDNQIAEHFGKFSALRSLSLEACTQITSKGLCSLGALCSLLVTLRLKVISIAIFL